MCWRAVRTGSRWPCSSTCECARLTERSGGGGGDSRGLESADTRAWCAPPHPRYDVEQADGRGAVVRLNSALGPRGLGLGGGELVRSLSGAAAGTRTHTHPGEHQLAAVSHTPPPHTHTVFHGAIVLGSVEFSFGFCEHGTGVYAVKVCARGGGHLACRVSTLSTLTPSPLSAARLVPIPCTPIVKRCSWV